VLNINIFFILLFRKQCIYSDDRLDFLKELVKNVPDRFEEIIDNNSIVPLNVKKKQLANNDSDSEEEM